MPSERLQLMMFDEFWHLALQALSSRSNEVIMCVCFFKELMLLLILIGGMSTDKLNKKQKVTY